MYKTVDYNRQAGSNALISKDNKALSAYKMQRNKNIKYNSLEQEVQSMKDDLSQIKELLVKLIDRK